MTYHDASIYDNTQQAILVVASVFSGFLSLIGSSIIVRIILSDFKNKLAHVYHRILFAMSIIDIFSSLNSMFGFSMVPRGYFWGAAGNTLTCSMSGLMFELGTSVGMYNLGLSLYYYLSLRAKKKQRFISTYVEPIIHFVCLILPLTIGVWAWVSEALNPLRGVGGWCYIYKFPPRCNELEDVECTRGSNWFAIGAISMLGKGVPVWLGIVIAMTLLWRYVRAQEKSVERYRSHPETARTRQAFHQALMYIFAYFLTYIFSLVNLFLPSDAIVWNFYVALMVKITLPLQGFFNFSIYIRPRIFSMRERNEYKDKPFLELVYIIITRRRDTKRMGRRRQRDSFILPAFQSSISSLHFQMNKRTSKHSITSITSKTSAMHEGRTSIRSAIAEIQSCNYDYASEDDDDYVHKMAEFLERNPQIKKDYCSDSEQEIESTNLSEDEQKCEEV